jgi:uncharacterized phage protein (TIGR01671 family)
MRDLKFRVWDKKDKRYIEWWELIFPLYQWEEERRININEQHYRNTDSHWDNNDIRFDIDKDTWLRDKNGVEIYEGDIVKTWHNFSKFDYNKDKQEEFCTGSWVCKWDTPRFIFTPNDERCIGLKTSMNPEFCEVIGNIHENPLLLNK